VSRLWFPEDAEARLQIGECGLRQHQFETKTQKLRFTAVGQYGCSRGFNIPKIPGDLPLASLPEGFGDRKENLASVSNET
jgi:hypothetical protein